METRKQIYTLFTLGMAFVWTWLVSTYDKLDALWFGSISVMVVGIVIAALIAVGMMHLKWFKNLYNSTKWWVALMVVGGFILSSVLGITLTEPVYTEAELSDMPTASREYDYSRTRTGGFYYYYFASSSGDGGGASLGDIISSIFDSVDGEEGFYLLVFFAVVAIILASAVFPHFWVVGGLLLVVMMMMITYREFMLEKRKNKYSY